MSVLVEQEWLAAEWVLEWSTDVQPSWSGKERRAACLTYPRESYRFAYLEEDLDLAAFRSDRAVSPTDTWLFPLRYEAMALTSGATAGATSCDLDGTYSDWPAVDQQVLFENAAGQQHLATITNVVGAGTSATTIDFDPAIPVGHAYIDGENAWVTPIVEVDLDDGSAMERYKVAAGHLALSGRDRTFHVTWGTGASLTTFETLTVLDRIPLGDDTAEEQNQAGLERLDAGFGSQQEVSRTMSDIVRFHQFSARFGAEAQWWRKFLHAVRGRQKAFLLPTWRPDAVVHTQPTPGAFTLRVELTPDYRPWFDDIATTNSHRRLQLLHADGSVEYVRVTAYATGAGFVDLTVTPALSGTAVTRVSLLELVRLEQDEVTVSVHMTHLALDISARVVQQ